MELSTEERAQIEAAHRVNFIIWFALVISVFLYNVIALVIELPEESLQKELSPIFEIILAGAGVISMVMAIVLKKIILSKKQIKSIRNLSPFKTWVALYRNAHVVQWALAEALAVWGLVGFILVGNQLFMFLMSFASLIAFGFFRPSKVSMENLLEEKRREGAY